MEEIVKQQLVTLEIHNRKQTKLINGLMQELASIHKQLCYINGTEIQIYNEQMWTRLTKSQMFPISLFLGLEETLNLRLLSKSFNSLIIGTFSIYQYKFKERLRQIDLELKQVARDQQELPYLNTYAQEIYQVTNENFDMKMIRGTKNPTNIEMQVMSAALVLFKIAETKENVTWKQIKRFLRNHDDVYTRLTGLNYLSATDDQLRELEKNLEGATLEECQNDGVVVTLTYSRLSSIIDYCKLPIVKVLRTKSRLTQEMKKIQKILQIFYKYV